MTATRKTKPQTTESTKQIVRCAIYTRKSSDDNLDTDFNSLDAQREAAEMYIASQKHEGWILLPETYADGGFSGGNTDRPGFKRLMHEVESGRVDVIVVYKIDRLSRSLTDFAKMMDIFERHNVSLVSVTQQFNTSTSMGRLTVNILLSFAQFEREQITERIRDKVGAARRKGKWVGGLPPLGYDIVTEGRSGAGRLKINEFEADQVKEIFASYIRTGSIIDTLREIDARGWRTKVRPSKTGGFGGKPYDKVRISQILNNYTYIGQVNYQNEIYAGEHDAIIDEATWNITQELLASHRKAGGKATRNRSGAILRGLVACKSCGCGMTHTWSGGASKNGRKYRYYVCQTAQKRGWEQCPTKSVPAVELEKFIIEQIRAIGSDTVFRKQVIDQVTEQKQQEIDRLENDLKLTDKEIRHCQRQTNKNDIDSQEHLDELSSRQKQLKREIQALSKTTITSQEIIDAVKQFDPIWGEITYSEQERIVRLLIEKVTIDGENSRISISFRSSGFKALNVASL